MKQLTARRIDGPVGIAYLCERDDGSDVMIWDKDTFTREYSFNLFDTLNKEGIYKSPKQDPNQLDLPFTDFYEEKATR